MNNQTPTSALPDEEIIELYWKRSESAIKETDKKYHSYLYTIAYNIVHDETESGDCLNDTYLTTWNKIPPARPNVFRAFLTKILRNSAVDKFRRNSVKRRIPSEMIISLEELENSIEYTEITEREAATAYVAEILNDFLKTLSPRSEFIFVCRYFFCDSIKDIAKMLVLSESTIMRELSSIKGELKATLSKEGYSV